METNDTIAALSTPRGLGALAVIRVSGPDAILLVKKNIAEKKKYDKASPNEIKIYRYVDENPKDVIDEITAIKYCAPNSFTGEDMVEIICHGGDVVAERILESLVDEGARYAGRGEFTRRAFCNGKTNLAKAESINQIVNSRTVIQQKNAIRSYLGGYETLINKWKDDIEDILIDVESEIEFSEDDDISERDSIIIIKKKVKALKEGILSELDKRKVIKEINEGIDVAIIGPTNAGKSSLLNLILGYDRAIVDSEEGTTRDFVSETKKIGDMQVKFIDTAGLKQTEKRIEKMGIEMSRGFIENSKIVIWVTAADERIKREEREIREASGQKFLGIINKVDLSEGVEKEKMFEQHSIPYIKTIAIESKERGKVEKFIVKELEEKYREVEYDSVIGNKRQEKIIEAIYKEIPEIEKRSGGEWEIISLHCRNMLNKLEEFVGKTTTEDLLDRIFSEFCIGK